MCVTMTKDDLEVFKDEVVSAYTDYILADDAVTKEKLFLNVQDMYMAMLDEKKECKL